MAEAIRETIIVVDDDPWMRHLITQVGEGEGYEVRAAANVATFRELARTTEPALLLVDLRIGPEDGVEALRVLADLGCRAPNLVLSAFGSRIQQTARRVGETLGLQIAGLLHKPIHPDALADALSNFPQPNQPIQEEELKAALRDKELFLEFQPILQLYDCSPIGAEALIRLQHPRLGTLAPGDFLPLFDRARMSAQILETTLEIGCREVARWRRDGCVLPISINFSPNVLDDPKLPQQVLDIVRRYGLSIPISSQK